MICIQEAKYHQEKWSYVNTQNWLAHTNLLSTAAGKAKRGTITFINPIIQNKAQQITLPNKFTIFKGNVVHTKLITQKIPVHIINIHAPNKTLGENNKFFQKLSKYVKKITEPVIIIGDFNVHPLPIDSISDKTHNYAGFEKFINSNKLKDKFRKLHPTSLQFSWATTHQGQIIKTRIDHIYTRKCKVSEVEYVPNKIDTDHLQINTLISKNITSYILEENPKPKLPYKRKLTTQQQKQLNEELHKILPITDTKVIAKTIVNTITKIAPNTSKINQPIYKRNNKW